MIAALIGESCSRVEEVEISRALAAGRRVATSSKEALTPQIATDFFELFSKADFTICSPSLHLSPLGLHPRFLSIGNQPQMRLEYLRGMPLWCGSWGSWANQSKRESQTLRISDTCG
jgi:hypothetical protein